MTDNQPQATQRDVTAACIAALLRYTASAELQTYDAEKGPRA